MKKVIEMKKQSHKNRAIVLLSGGADSRLAMQMMHEQGINMLALNFKSCFCTCPDDGCGGGLRQTCEQLGASFKTLFLGDEYLQMIANPRFGYGKGMNPCIDCRILMFKKARELMVQEGAGFIVTGEVVGQRPMSQKLKTMKLIENESGLRGRILRPLSARILPPTYPELAGIVDRGKLMDIAGRSRKPQMKLAEDLGVGEIPCAAGGCLLTDRRFADKVADLYAHTNGQIPSVNDARLLRFGRHFRFKPTYKVVVGKDKKENQALHALAGDGDLLFNPDGRIKGPVALTRGDVSEADLPQISSLVARYCNTDGRNVVVIEFRSHPDGAIRQIEVEPMSTEESPEYLI